MKHLKKIAFSISFIIIGYSAFSQGRYNNFKDKYVASFLSKKFSTTFGLSLTPRKYTKNYGVCLNVFSKENQTNNGINIELVGSGVMNVFTFSDDYADNQFQIKKTSIYNGLSISPLGLNSKGEVNGLAINGIGCAQTQINGTCLSLIATNIMILKGFNLSSFSSIGYMKGLQLGIINYCINGKGATIGIYNTCQKFKGIIIGVMNNVGGKSYPVVYLNLKNNN